MSILRFQRQIGGKSIRTSVWRWTSIYEKMSTVRSWPGLADHDWRKSTQSGNFRIIEVDVQDRSNLPAYAAFRAVRLGVMLILRGKENRKIDDMLGKQQA